MITTNWRRELGVLIFLDSGATLDALGEVYGVSHERIRQIGKRNGHVGRHVSTNDVLQAVAVTANCAEASDLLGVSVHTVRQAVQSSGRRDEIMARWRVDFRFRQRRYPNERLIEVLRSVADELGRAPHAHEMTGSGPSWNTYRQRFGSWEAALRRAGLAVHCSGRGYKLTSDQRAQLRKEAKTGIKNGNTRELAARYGVHQSLIYYYAAA